MAGFSVSQYGFLYQGLPAASGTLYIYQTGTTTPVTIYADGGLTIPLSNPLTLDANGNAAFYYPGTVNLKLVAFTVSGTLIQTLDPVYPTGGSSSSTSSIPWVISGGTPDIITATYNPTISSLTDGLLLSFRATAANTTTTPTFSPNGLLACTITQKGGAALIAGNIAANLAEYIIRFNLANTHWELLNPTYISTGTPIAVPRIQTFNSTGTYTANANLLYAEIEVWGAGGGGGGVSSAASSNGGGGGAGGYSKGIYSAATIGSSQSITIGAGGTAGTNTGGTGGTGGTSSVGSGPIIQATGGAGGIGSTDNSSHNGGAGGLGSSGNINATGQAGFPSFGATTSTNGASGAGGTTLLGGNGAGISTGSNSAGNNGIANSGSGAGGAAGQSSAHAGGVGGSGYVYITEYCSS